MKCRKTNDQFDSSPAAKSSVVKAEKVVKAPRKPSKTKGFKKNDETEKKG